MVSGRWWYAAVGVVAAKGDPCEDVGTEYDGFYYEIEEGGTTYQPSCYSEPYRAKFEIGQKS